MRTILSVFGQQYAERQIGVSGENEATVLEIDVRSVLQQYPSAYFSIKLKRADGALYIAAAGLAAGVDAVVRYTVTAADVSVAGLLEMEVQATVENVVIKTSRYYFGVSDAIDTGWPLPPDPTWVDDVIEAAARSQDGAARAEDAADRAEAALDGLSDDAARAEAAAERAQESRDAVEAIAAGFMDEETQRQQNEIVRQDSEAERVALYDVIREEYESGGFNGSPLYVTFGVDFDAGDLLKYVPEGYDGPEFAINDYNIEVSVGGGVPIALGRAIPMPAGDYSAAVAYPFLAVVYYQGDAYLSKRPTQGNPPTNTAYWMRVTSVGEGTKVSIGQVATGAPGTAAAIVNVGTEKNQVWNITIPRGQDGGGGIGDMTKAVYDKNGDGIVDDAAALGGVAAAGYALKTAVPSDAVRYDTAQTLTTTQKESVRTKIGAGTSSFDGKYASLADAPGDILRYDTSQTLTTTQQAAVRSKIGAGTSNFNGQYGSLTGAPNDILRYDTAQTLTPTQQAAVRSKIGAGASGFDGDYNSLTNKPTIPSTAADIGAVPTSRTVNGKPLNANISLAKADVQLGNVDNTSDANKPISTAAQAALNGKSDTNHTHSQYLTAESDPTVPAWAKAETKPTYTPEEVKAVPLNGGTMTGDLIANNPAIGTSAVRNSYAGTADMTPGVTPLTTGTIYYVYE